MLRSNNFLTPRTPPRILLRLGELYLLMQNLNTLLITCQVLIHAPNDSQIRARGTGSSTSFVSQRLVQSLGLQRSSNNLLEERKYLNCIRSTSHRRFERMPVTAIVVSCDLSVQPTLLNSKLQHL